MLPRFGPSASLGQEGLWRAGLQCRVSRTLRALAMATFWYLGGGGLLHRLVLKQCTELYSARAAESQQVSAFHVSVSAQPSPYRWFLFIPCPPASVPLLKPFPLPAPPPSPGASNHVAPRMHHKPRTPPLPNHGMPWGPLPCTSALVIQGLASLTHAPEDRHPSSHGAWHAVGTWPVLDEQGALTHPETLGIPASSLLSGLSEGPFWLAKGYPTCDYHLLQEAFLFVS